MISVIIFGLLLVLAMVLFIYALADLNNRIYGNIVAGIMSTVLFGYSAVIANTGIVQDGTEIMQDLSLQIILLIPTAITMIYTAYMVWDAYQEAQEASEE